ncbi:c-type cytochrome [Kordiimonas aquimaris]|uniref:c-type cytochrome n=1 Tax=Kordiimonas aquimaris TaxID=707591 RepID=UPI0021D2848F|nr:c-type cytochrome [Kordiimonas aquimaris]
MRYSFRMFFLACLLSLNLAIAQQQVVANDVERGEKLYSRRCGACHSIDVNRIGPKHRGLLGRTAGSLTDYDYSDALSHSSVVWTKETLNAWLENPQALIPGQKMGFRLKKEDERQDIIAYLVRLKD